MHSLIIFDDGRRDGGYGCFAGDGGTSLYFISALIYFPGDAGNNAHRSRRFANPHVVGGMPGGWALWLYSRKGGGGDVVVLQGRRHIIVFYFSFNIFSSGHGK